MVSSLCRRVVYMSLCVFSLVLAGCGGGGSHSSSGGSGSGGGGGSTSNPAPTVSSLSPAKIVAGGAAQTLTITGTNFISSSTVTYAGTAHMATFGSSTSLTIPLTTSDVSAAGQFPVVVTNPSPGGGNSTAVNFEVDNPAPVITSLNPSSIAAGAAPQAVTVIGTGFVSGSQITFAGNKETTTFNSATQLTFTPSATDIATAGQFPVVVVNATPGGGSSTAVNFTVNAVNGPMLSGAIYRGPNTIGATVTAYEVNTDGTNGNTIGTGNQNADGTFSVVLDEKPSTPVRLTATGGTYTSPYDGKSTINATSSLSLLLDSASANQSGLTISALSDLVNSRAAGEMAGVKSSAALRMGRNRLRANAAGSVVGETQAHADASKLLLAFFGLKSTDVPENLPVSFSAADITANPDQFQFGMALGAYAEQGSSVDPSSSDDFIAAISKDITDGVFDGLSGTTPITFGSNNSITLSPSAGTSDFLLALGQDVNSGGLIAALNLTPTLKTQVQALQNNILNGVYASSATPSSSSLSSSTSGAVTTYSANGKQYVILAARSEGVVVIDVTDPTAATPKVNAWPTISSSIFGGLDVGGVISFISPSGKPEVLSYAFDSTKIAILDTDILINGNPSTDNPVVSTTTLTFTNPEVGFSGGDAYIAGGIAAGSGVWLDTVDGYQLFDLTTSAISTTAPKYTVDPSQEIAENMGGDIAHQLLLAGNYRGLQYVDLAKQKSYYMSGQDLSALFPALDGSYLVDGNSVDSGYGVGILNTEDGTTAAFMNLGSITETDASGANTLNTLSIGSGGGVQVPLITSATYLEISGSAVDATTHQVLFMNEFSTYFVVGTLQDPKAVPSGSTWQGLSSWSYYNMGQSGTVTGFEQPGDPHSVGVIFNPATQKAYGYLLNAGNGYKGVLQIDLAAFQALPASGTTGDAAHTPASDPTAGANAPVREITWQ